jgi:hypothetical protein
MLLLNSSKRIFYAKRNPLKALAKFHTAYNPFFSNEMHSLETPLTGSPFLNLPSINETLHLNPSETIKDLQTHYKSHPLLKTLSLHTLSDEQFALHTSLSHILEYPFLLLKCTSSQNHSPEHSLEHSFSIVNTRALDLNTEKTHIPIRYSNIVAYLEQNKSLNLRYSRIIAEFLCILNSKLRNLIDFKSQKEEEGSKELKIGIEDLGLCVKESLMEKTRLENEEKQILLLCIKRIQLQVEGMKEEMGEINVRSRVSAIRVVHFIMGFLMVQFGLTQYGTYVLFSWDIMEPITCLITFGDACLAYFFWMISKKSYSQHNIFQFFALRKQNKLFKKHNFEHQQYQSLCQLQNYLTQYYETRYK